MAKGRNGYSGVGRFDLSGSTSTQRRKNVTDTCDVDELMEVDTVGAEFARKSYNKYEVPTCNSGDGLDGLDGIRNPGGNAGSNGKYNTADYPGGMT